MPRLLCALPAAGFVANLISSALFSTLLGADAGFPSLIMAAAAGTLIPAGPVIAFSISAVVAAAGAGTPALVAFFTSWSVFAAHRILIHEIPMLGFSFLRLRPAATGAMPILAGLFAMDLGLVAGLLAGT